MFAYRSVAGVAGLAARLAAQHGIPDALLVPQRHGRTHVSPTTSHGECPHYASSFTIPSWSPFFGLCQFVALSVESTRPSAVSFL